MTENDTSSVITKGRFKEQEKKSGIKNMTLIKTVIHVQSLYFDGKKDQTLTQVLINGSMHKQTVVEEHIAFIKKPKSQYVGHFTTVTE